VKLTWLKGTMHGYVLHHFHIFTPAGCVTRCACLTASLNVRPGGLKDRLVREELQQLAADEQPHVDRLSWGCQEADGRQWGSRG
jgi:hypothetical protein